jgi:hypothetical protein
MRATTFTRKAGTASAKLSNAEQHYVAVLLSEPARRQAVSTRSGSKLRPVPPCKLDHQHQYDHKASPPSSQDDGEHMCIRCCVAPAQESLLPPCTAAPPWQRCDIRPHVARCTMAAPSGVVHAAAKLACAGPPGGMLHSTTGSSTSCIHKASSCAFKFCPADAQAAMSATKGARATRIDRSV